MNHRNVCPTYDLFRLEGPRGPVLCLTMKLLRGESLAARLRRLGPMPPEAVLPIVRQLAAGLDAAHAAGVIHRDFKPGNVILEQSGQNPQVSITDFGLSRPYDSDHTLGIGKVAGTRGYIAPELFEGRTASPASDVYAFGMVLHEILTGRQPVTKPGSRDFVKPSGLGQAIPEVWDRIILGCLAPDPSKRFQSPGNRWRSWSPRARETGWWRRIPHGAAGYGLRAAAQSPVRCSSGGRASIFFYIRCRSAVLCC